MVCVQGDPNGVGGNKRFEVRRNAQSDFFFLGRCLGDVVESNEAIGYGLGMVWGRKGAEGGRKR